MAARKVQIEMDKVFKKVDEGLLNFEVMWDRVYDSAFHTNREKNEEKLKKELKKLQRYRHQINQWVADDAIKVKTKLLEYLIRIEEKMEMFKECEREAKLKAFSNMGLLETKVDPVEKEKEDAEEWITVAISQLKKECETTEAELEACTSAKKKKKRKDKKSTRACAILEKLQRHEHHVQRLERALRSLHNGNVTPQQIWDIRDGVEYYIESNEDPSFVEDEELYKDLDLEPVMLLGPHRNPRQKSEKEEERERAGRETNSDKRKISPEPGKHEAGDKGETHSHAAKGETPKCEKDASIEDEIGEDIPSLPLTADLNSFTPVHEEKQTSGSDYSQAQESRVSVTEVGGNQVRTTAEDHGLTSLTAIVSTRHAVGEGVSPVRITIREDDSDTGGVDATSDNRNITNLGYHSQGVPAIKDTAENAVANVDTVAISETVKEFNLDNEDPVEFPVLEQSAKKRHIMEQEERDAREFGRIRAQRYGRIGTIIPQVSEKRAAEDLAALDASLRYFPEPDLCYARVPDSSESKQRAKQNEEEEASKTISEYMQVRLPIHIPRKFPSSVSPTGGRAKFLKKVNVDVLFFIFYYEQETEDQFLAAIELRHRGWKLHKELHYWFLRKGTPGDLEAYVFFDFKMHLEAGRIRGWHMRKVTEIGAEESFNIADLV